MSHPYHKIEKADALKESYRTARETLEGIAGRELTIFSGEPDEHRDVVAEIIDQHARQVIKIEIDPKTNEIVSVIEEVAVASEEALEQSRGYIHGWIKEDAKAIEDSLTSIGYEKVTIKNSAYALAQKEPANLEEGVESLGAVVEILGGSPEHFTVYVRHDGDHLDILTDKLLHVDKTPPGVSLYRTTENDVHEWYLSFSDLDAKAKIGSLTTSTLKFGGGFGAYAASVIYIASTMQETTAVIATAGGLILTGLAVAMKKGSQHMFNTIEKNYKNLVGVVETDNALLEAVKPTVEHEEIMNPPVEEEIKERTLRQRVKDYMHTPVIDLLRGKGPKVRVEVEDGKILDKHEIERLAMAEAEK